MAFLDWLKERPAPRQDVTQRPEPSWQKYPAQEQYNPVAQMSESEKAKAREIGERINRATQHLQPGENSRPSPVEDASGNGPHRQNQSNQQRVAPALTPTDGNVGKTSQEAENRPSPKAPENPTPVQTPPRSPQRGRGGWER
jgi:hypothetical protein